MMLGGALSTLIAVLPPRLFAGSIRFVSPRCVVPFPFVFSSASFLFLPSNVSHLNTAALNPQPFSPSILLFPVLRKISVFIQFESRVFIHFQLQSLIFSTPRRIQ